MVRLPSPVALRCSTSSRVRHPSISATNRTIPYANEEGFVAYPNVSPVEEMANMISASRSFQLNVEVMNTAKTLAERVLNLGQ